MKKNIMKNESMKLFTMLSGYFLSVLLLYSIFQFFKIQNLSLIQILSITIPIISYLIVNKKNQIKKQLITVVLYLLILLIIPFTYNRTYDLTVDGNSYHKSAIAFIKSGWNPIHETMRSFQKNNNDIIEIKKGSRVDLWVEHYPKATWIIAATMYNMTGSIESGKCITLIVAIMLLIISYNCLNTILSRKWSSIISILLVLNPIVLAQFFTYYVDGLLGMLFAIELLLLMQINPKEKINKTIWLSIIATCCILVNIKFTGLLCSGVIAAVYYFYHLIVNRKDKKWLTIFKRLTISFTIVFGLSIFLVGANSYVKNTIDHHNPLYPIIGKDKVDIVTTMQPKSFKNKSKIEKFLISTFSRTENVTYKDTPKLKLPIKVYRSEIDNLYIPDARMAGFGPLSALVFIVSIVLFITSGIILIKKEKENSKYLILPLISIIISAILVGESWWARYIPQFYLLPIGTLVTLIYLRKYYDKLLLKLISYGFILLIVANISFFLYVDYQEIKTFSSIYEDIEEIKEMDKPEISISSSDLYGYLYTLNDYDVDYILVEDVPDDVHQYMYYWRLEVKTSD